MTMPNPDGCHPGVAESQDRDPVIPVLARTAEDRVYWVPAFAGMTNAKPYKPVALEV